MKNKDQIVKIWDVLDSLNVDVLHNKQAIIKLENEREQPQPKQLDQTAFDHRFVTETFNYAAVNKNGSSVFFENKPELHTHLDIWKPISGSFMPMLNGYDANDWQNSLIERDKVELTGSDLAMAILDSGKNIMCIANEALRRIKGGEL